MPPPVPQAKPSSRPRLRPQQPAVGVGRRVGSAIGGWVGDMAQKALATVTGMGDYEVKSNSITQRLGAGGSTSTPSSPPSFLSSGGSTRICHREFLGLVTSPGAGFSITAFPLNPSSSISFPWLSEQAFSYETFRLRGAVVEFVSTYGDAVSSTNASLGSVILATQYNASAPPFSSQSSMENYEFATSCKPSTSMIHPIECDPSQLVAPHLYVFPGSTSSGVSDARWSTHGVTYLATVGQQSAATLGELWISYDIELYQPKLLAGVATSGLSCNYQFGNTQANSAWQVAMLANMFNVPGSIPGNPSYAGDLVLVPPISNSNLFAFPAGLTGNFVITWLAGVYNNVPAVNCTVPAFGTNPRITNGSLINRFTSNTSTPPNNGASIYVATTGNNGPLPQFIVVFAVACTPSAIFQGTIVDLSPCWTSNWGNLANAGAGVSIMNQIMITPLAF